MTPGAFGAQPVTNPRLVRRSIVLAMTIAALVTAVGAGHLAAWLSGYMGHLSLTAVTMKTNAALGLILTGLSLMALAWPNAGPVLGRASQALALIAAVLGALTLVENLTDWDFGIDQLLATEPPGAVGVYGVNRMGIPASTSLLLGGVSLLCLRRGTDRSSRIGQLLALGVSVIALFASLGYMYGAQTIYAITRLTAVAWPTAAALLALGIGMLLARPAEGFMARVMADDPGGIALRRWLPAALVPVAVGWARLAGERAGWFDAATGTSGVMLVLIVALLAFAYRSSVHVRRSSAAIRDREERLRLSHEAARMGAFDWDIRNDANVWTPELESIHGLAPGSFPKRLDAWAELIHPDDRAAAREAIAAALSTGDPAEAEWRTIWPDGTVHWISARWRVFRDESGAPVRMVGVNLEITDRKRMEQALEATVRDLERSNDQLEQFAYICAHDLQEPLRHVRTFIELLKRHLGNVDETANHYFGYIYTGAERMSEMVTGILEYSRVGRAGSAQKRVECESSLHDALLKLGAAISDSGAQVTHDALPAICGSPMQMRQLFQNLIGNAIKFRREGVAPTIHIACRRDGNAWLFTVEDNGIGIPPEYHAKVFRIFQRLHEPEKYRGAGIGLAICQKIVETHRGKIWIDAEFREGARFCFTIPDAAASTNAGSARAAGYRGG